MGGLFRVWRRLASRLTKFKSNFTSRYENSHLRLFDRGTSCVRFCLVSFDMTKFKALDPGLVSGEC
jgi:hypothetical protein